MDFTTIIREELTPYKMANIAKLSYFDEDKFKEEIIQFTKPDDIYFYDASIDGYSDAQLYTLIYKDKIIFSVRGTSSIKDAVTDIKFTKRIFQDVQYTVNKNKYKNIKVHKGFLSQFNTIKFRIISYVFAALWGNKCKNPETDKIHIIFTSHSLGAAISTLASSMLKAHFNDKVFVENWTFGCPRVGNNSFIKYYEDNVDMSYIYIYGNDIVTKIPKIGFKTFNKCIFLKDTFENPPWFIKKLNFYFGEVDDHFIDNYIRALDDDKTILLNNSVLNLNATSNTSQSINETNNSITKNSKNTKNTTVITITHPYDKVINSVSINVYINNDYIDSLHDKQSNKEENEYKEEYKEQEEQNREKEKNNFENDKEQELSDIQSKKDVNEEINENSIISIASVII